MEVCDGGSEDVVESRCYDLYGRMDGRKNRLMECNGTQAEPLTRELRCDGGSEDVVESAIKRLLRQRGNAAYRKTRALLNNIGRKEQVPKETYQMLVSDSNPVRNRNYEQ